MVRPLSVVCLFALALPAAAQPPSGPPPATLAIRVLDASGAIVPGAEVRVTPATGAEMAALTDREGRIVARGLDPGVARVRVEGQGFAPAARAVDLRPGHTRTLDVTLEVGGLTASVRVAPDRVLAGDAAIRRVPGSVDVIDLAAVESARVVSTAELLRKAPGVHVRDEEGLGLRPNIGLRGLNPTRSTRVLLLEDGIPLTYAPYGDNAAYYHPPVERFERVELLKGSGQIAYGPMTVGGVINYVTPAPPGQSRGTVLASGGNRGHLNLQAGWGTTVGRTGLQLDVVRKAGDGSRENISTDVADVTGKVVTRLDARHVLTLRGSYLGEESNITYSGLREAEFRENPRQNPFRNDFFYIDRYGASVTHAFTITDRLVATTNLYTSDFRRHWWRQSSNSAQRPNDAADPACGGMANLNTTCGNEGRLRHYRVWGVEPRFHASTSFAGMSSETTFGLRLHVEDQERRQENGATPEARTGAIVENNERQNTAVSGFVQNRFVRGPWSVSPGVRLERVGYERTNRLLGMSGAGTLTEVIPGIGAAYSPTDAFTAFAGVHRGFTPPRTEDFISNTTGGVVDLDPERSWNYELGVRQRPLPGLQLDATFFRMDYENQIIPASLAGGVGATLTNGGETLHQGIELGARVQSAGWRGAAPNLYGRVAYAWLPIARFEGTRFSTVSGFTRTSVTGNRLPYAPEHLLTASVGAAFAAGLDINLEAVVTGRQFADDLNTINPTPDGQRGLLEAYTLWNAAANHRANNRITLFVAVKNLFDRTAIVDRSRGILPTIPRTGFAGVKLGF